MTIIKKNVISHNTIHKKSYKHIKMYKHIMWYCTKNTIPCFYHDVVTMNTSVKKNRKTILTKMHSKEFAKRTYIEDTLL